jgi:hypothetical protein
MTLYLQRDHDRKWQILCTTENCIEVMYIVTLYCLGDGQGVVYML